MPLSPALIPAIFRTLNLRDYKLLQFSGHLLVTSDIDGGLGVVSYGLDTYSQPSVQFNKLFFTLSDDGVWIAGKTQWRDITFTMLDPEPEDSILFDLAGKARLVVPENAPFVCDYYPLDPQSWKCEEGPRGLWIVVEDLKQTGEVVWVTPKKEEGGMLAVRVTGTHPAEDMWEVWSPGDGTLGAQGFGVADDVYEVPKGVEQRGE